MESRCTINFTTAEVTITGVELLADHNQENHHTHEYECPQFLIARRGAAVDIEVYIYSACACAFNTDPSTFNNTTEVFAFLYTKTAGAVSRGINSDTLVNIQGHFLDSVDTWGLYQESLFTWLSLPCRWPSLGPCQGTVFVWTCIEDIAPVIAGAPVSLPN